MVNLWPEKWLGDPDNALAFTTPKTVKIRDFRLGLLNYTLQFVIFLYIVVFAVFIEQGYNTFEPIYPGAISISSRRDSSADATNANYSYCCYESALGGTQADWAADNVCNGTVSGSSVTYESTSDGAFPCLYWSADNTVYQVGLATSVALVSRVGIKSQARCALDVFNSACTSTSVDTDETMYYIAGIEHFTLRFRHGVAGQIVDVSGQNVGPSRMTGSLVNKDNDKVTVAVSNDAGDPGTDFSAEYGDQMSLLEILSAADINIDAIRLDPANTSRTSTIRYDGINVVIYITYGLESFSRNIRYTYKPRILSDLEYKVEELVADENSTSQVEYNRHAIRILTVQTGRLGKFSFQALLITLVSALGLLAVSATIVNLIMTKLLPLSAFYQFAKTEVTEDFSVFRDVDEPDEQAAYDELLATVKDANSGRAHRINVERRVATLDSKLKEKEGVPVERQYSSVHAPSAPIELNSAGDGSKKTVVGGHTSLTHI
mmetsp:Transcript_35742/g.93460  ORF Transcript_35742/g.93460 Transcript_35742/m.93460 type:complete len:490 (-) Transcript_35742:181-1650(-)|eukprot:CAMPEP_0182918368 /NCGR_PEP_ID=MMETSP0105_2-20130417/2052_1 /TAXON_ID=81532 ORGANISM="Acanthoeca-like sp., Strain 10tr" /NCGR_SAMPLE_ID=MMETSP0105_2 /ASSEMBLY_ACC=CAM_ASM_000205 /LENGTH=489 /DNA_ID=CAMNT_0025055451 /DNA_START=26 /DNA_END=1495 /DNA_ORIENTATION=-